MYALYHRVVEKIEIVEVGLRDGLQTAPVILPTETKLSIVERLAVAGARKIQVCSFVHPKIVPQMADAEALCASIQMSDLLNKFDILYSGLILNTKGLERARATGVVNCADMSISASDTHSQKNTNKTTHQALEELKSMIASARGFGMTVRAGVQCSFGCVYEGNVPQSRVLNLVEKILTCGVDELLLADSTGMANPKQIREMMRVVLPLAGNVPVVLHLHDTRAMGLANVLAAVDCGARQFDTAFGGLGGCPFIEGAAGNISTEDTIHMLHEMGFETGIDPAQIARITRDLEAMFGHAVPSKMARLL